MGHKTAIENLSLTFFNYMQLKTEHLSLNLVT